MVVLAATALYAAVDAGAAAGESVHQASTTSGPFKC
jgi:hypothetical protein